MDRENADTWILRTPVYKLHVGTIGGFWKQSILSATRLRTTAKTCVDLPLSLSIFGCVGWVLEHVLASSKIWKIHHIYIYISFVGKPWIHVDLLEGICLPRWYRSFFVPWDPIISICFLVSSYLIFGTPMVPCPDHILFSNPKWVCPRLRFSPKSSGSKAHASHEHRCIGAYHIPFRIDSNMSPTLLKKP